MAFEQPADFRAESDALYAVLAPLADADFARTTQFKGWTINDVVSHLHAWNWAADLSLRDPEAFVTFRTRLLGEIAKGRRLREVEAEWLDGSTGHAQLDTWRTFYTAMTERFAAADPKRRVGWAGPDMSVRSSISARLMETWAHGQEVYDLLGATRSPTDRLLHIATIGVKTFGWTFANRRQEPPGPPPYVRLVAPSGAIWEWNPPTSEQECVRGDALDFCLVVVQGRNVADTALEVAGPVATRWMSIAQCFAGPPVDPPKPGERRTASRS